MEPQPHTPLMMAILQQMPASAVKFALNSMRDGSDWVDRSDPNMNVTPLVAVMCARDDDDAESIKIAKLLVRNGAGINTHDSGPGATPLWMTAQLGKPKLMRYLLSQGAHIERTPTTSRTTAITLACMNGRTAGHVECVAMLANAGRTQNKLHLLDVPNELQGRTAAWCAVARGFAEIVGILTKAGADLRTACPCWFEIFIMDGDRTANIDISAETSPVSYALNAAVFSHVHSSCIVCRAKMPNILKCSRCQLASYCSSDCQKKDYKASHKRVCKRIRKGMDMYGDMDDSAPPPQSHEKFGFEEAFAGDDFEVPEFSSHDGEDYDLDKVPKWEYDDGPAGEAVWRRYPPNIEESIESLLQSGSPKYMYRPGHSECKGLSEREISPQMPSGVSTNYIWFSDMIEREVYTGAGRAVRRNGSSETPQCKDPLF